jgi:quercetin dioxygenase-like cupin family protein
MKDIHRGKFIVGKISDHARRKGWFFGHFAQNDLLRSTDVEVSWQKISGKIPEANDKHLHSSSVEINIVINGKVTLSINGKNFSFYKEDFWVIWPDTIVKNVQAGENTELIVIRSPSVNDKVIMK